MKPDNRSNSKRSEPDVLADTWAVRRQRGLSDSEKAEFEALAAQNEGFAKEVAEAERAFDFIGRVSPRISDDLLADDDFRPLWRRPAWQLGGIAALVAVGLFVSQLIWLEPRDGFGSGTILASDEGRPTTERLEDGTVVRVNAGSELAYAFAGDKREVKLSRGEAHFTVVEDPKRPFVVFVDKVQVVAVGTAFNVRRGTGRIDVFVTEGTVAIGSEALAMDGGKAVSPQMSSGGLPGGSGNFVRFGQKAEIQYTSASESVTLSISQTNENELKQALGWRDSLLSFSGSTLAEIAADFDRKTGLRIVIDDPRLNDLQIGGNYPTDDPFGFLNILRNNYGVDWVETGDRSIALTGRRD